MRVELGFPLEDVARRVCMVALAWVLAAASAGCGSSTPETSEADDVIFDEPSATAADEELGPPKTVADVAKLLRLALPESDDPCWLVWSHVPGAEPASFETSLGMVDGSIVCGDDLITRLAPHRCPMGAAKFADLHSGQPVLQMVLFGVPGAAHAQPSVVTGSAQGPPASIARTYENVLSAVLVRGDFGSLVDAAWMRAAPRAGNPTSAAVASASRSPAAAGGPASPQAGPDAGVASVAGVAADGGAIADAAPLDAGALDAGPGQPRVVRASFLARDSSRTVIADVLKKANPCTTESGSVVVGWVVERDGKVSKPTIVSSTFDPAVDACVLAELGKARFAEQPHRAGVCMPVLFGDPLAESSAEQADADDPADADLHDKATDSKPAHSKPAQPEPEGP